MAKKRRRKQTMREWAIAHGVPPIPTEKELLSKYLKKHEELWQPILGPYALDIAKTSFLEIALKRLAPKLHKEYKAYVERQEAKIKAAHEVMQKESKHEA